MTADPTTVLAGLVAQLADRVAKLEARPPRRSEALSPSYLRIDPATGQTSAVFPGGVQINAGRTSTPPNERRVRWVTDDTGVLIADLIGASADDKSASLNMVAHAHAGVGRGLVGAIDDLGAQAGLYGLVGSPGQPAAVTAYTTNQSATVLDDDGYSSFARRGELFIGAPIQAAGGADTGNVAYNLPALASGTYTVLLIYAGSGFPNALGTAYLNLWHDGAVVTSQPQFFNNGEHMAFQTRFAVLGGLAGGGHSVRVSPGTNCGRDANDWSNVAVIGLPTP